jgi:predicted RNase H-like HicB family nuclease
VTERGYIMQFDPLPEGGFSVFVPAIPEICTFGETLKEAREMAEDAISCYPESENKIQIEAKS